MAEADGVICADEDCTSIKSTSSTTSEEDAADKKEQLPQTPEIPKPEYNDEEISKLVDYIQRMTTLFALDQRDWNETSLDIIRRWLLEIDYTMLTIFYSKNVLTACLGFPLVPVSDLSYFLRENNQIFTVEGFHDEVHFGTIHDDVEGCLLHILRLVYAPMFRNCQEWNDNLQFRLCKALDKFLTFLTSLHYKMGGETVIYVPYMAKQLADEKVKEQRGLIKNLETLVVFWSTQIRTLLGDKVLSVSNDLVAPQEEYDFWLYRYEVLQGICLQLEQPEVKQIFELMRTTHSVYLHEIEELNRSCHDELHEAKSNIRFLALVIQPCAEIEKVENPSALPALIPRILHLTRYVWLRSEHFNRPELISGLLAKLSNQIIRFCINQIDIDKVLEGHSRFGIKMANMSIDCCLAYKEIYARISAEHARRPNQNGIGWNLDEALIFNHIDAFVERLNDLIEICEAMVVFGRLDETESIPKPCFGGTAGVEFDKTIDQVEQQFKACLETLRANGRRIILDVHQNDWHKHALDFRRTVQKLEETVQRLTSNAFQRIANIEEGLEVLNATLFYSYHSVIRKTYLRQVGDIWRMLNDDMLKTTKQLREKPNASHESWLPPFASRAINYRINLERLQWLRDRLYNSDWLPKVPEEKVVLAKFEAFRKDFEKQMRLIYDEWYQNCDSATLLNKLQRSLLMRNTKSNPGLLECNIDRAVLSICAEAEHFERLGFQVTGNIRALYDKHQALRTTYEQVLKVCLDYNHVLSALAPAERSLFRVFIQTCDRKISPGLSRLTWGDELNGAYFQECANQTACLRKTLDVYKRSNKLIALACEKICNTSFLKICLSHGPMELADFDSHMQRFCRKATKTVAGHYDAIVELLNAVHKEFQPFMSEMATEWSAHVRQFDLMLEAALLTSARNSLMNVSNVLLHSESGVPAAPVLIAELDIRCGEVQLNPEMSSIREIIEGLYQRIVQSLESFPRLSKKLRCINQPPVAAFSKIFSATLETRKLQKSIETELDCQQKELDDFLERWRTYEDVWLISEKEFVEKIKATDRSAKVYADSIEQHSDLAQSVVFQDSITQVHFVLLNQNPIKNALLDLIEKWQALNIKLLTRRAFSRMRQIHRYMSRHGSRITVVPRSLHEARRSLEFFHKLVADVSKKMKDIPQLLELFKLLDRHQISVPLEIRELIFSLDAEWETYMGKLIEADELLDSNRDDYKQTLLESIDECKAIMKQFFLDSKVKRLD